MHRGDTLLRPIIIANPKLKAHLWIVVTEPTADGSCVMVNITTPKGHRLDRTVVLQKGDHPFVQHESIISYGDAQIENVKDLLACVQCATAKRGKQQILPPLLRRIQDGVLKSPDTPHKVREFCKALWGIR